MTLDDIESIAISVASKRGGHINVAVSAREIQWNEDFAALLEDKVRDALAQFDRHSCLTP